MKMPDIAADAASTGYASAAAGAAATAHTIPMEVVIDDLLDTRSSEDCPAVWDVDADEQVLHVGRRDITPVHTAVGLPFTTVLLCIAGWFGIIVIHFQHVRPAIQPICICHTSDT